MTKKQLPPHLPETIKALRVFSNIPQRYLAHKLNVKQSTVSDIEKGVIKPCAHKLEIISDVLEMPSEDIMTLAERTPKANIEIALVHLKASGLSEPNKEDFEQFMQFFKSDYDKLYR